MEKFYELLGWRVRDKVTGFEGVVNHVGKDLFGCVMAIVQPTTTLDEKGEQKTADGRWYDVTRLQKLGNERVMEPVPSRYDNPPGPAEKPVR